MSSVPSSLSRTERKLQERVKALLPADEEVRAAVVAFKGPRAGAEGPLAPLLGVLAVVGVTAMRRFVTVAITNRGVVVFTNESARRPAAVAQRFADIAAIGTINDSQGDAFIEVGSERYWIEGIWSHQLFVIRRLKGSRER